MARGKKAWDKRLREARRTARENGWDPSWICRRADVVAVENGCWYDEVAGWDAVDLIERHFCHWQGEWAGEPFILEPWEVQTVREIFGWKRADGTRRIRTVYIEVPRKNGKSTLAAAIALLMLLFDGEIGASVVSAAADEEQARIVWNTASEMVQASPEVSKSVRIYKSSIADERLSSSYVVISARHSTKHGRNDSCVVFDELHAQPSPHLWNVLTTGVGSRTQPLVFAITTAGDDMQSICGEKHQLCLSFLNPNFEDASDDDTFYGYRRAADPRDTWWRLETWIKANPGLGLDDWIEPRRPDKTGYAGVKLRKDAPFKSRARTPETYLSELQGWIRRADLPRTTPTLDYLVDHARGALHSQLQRAAFLWLHLNIWGQGEVRFFDMMKFDKCRAALSLDDFKGRDVYGGMDRASVTDLAAFALVAPPRFEDDKWLVKVWYWVPAETATIRTQKDKVFYEQWIESGHLNACRGARISQNDIKRFILEVRDETGLDVIGYDDWNAGKLAEELDDEGLTMVNIPPGIKYFNAPTKEAEAQVRNREVRIDNNPVLRWNADNTVVVLDHNENVRPDKRKSVEKIDGVVAWLMAIFASGVEDESSVYNRERLAVVEA